MVMALLTHAVVHLWVADVIGSDFLLLAFGDRGQALLEQRGLEFESVCALRLLGGVTVLYGRLGPCGFL